MPGSFNPRCPLKSKLPAFAVHAQPAIFRIGQEAQGSMHCLNKSARTDNITTTQQMIYYTWNIGLSSSQYYVFSERISDSNFAKSHLPITCCFNAKSLKNISKEHDNISAVFCVNFQSHCRVLCKSLKRFGNWQWRSRRIRYCEFSVQDAFRVAILYCNIPRNVYMVIVICFLCLRHVSLKTTSSSKYPCQ